MVDGRHRFGGEELQLALTEPERGHALHGLSPWLDFHAVDGGADSDDYRTQVGDSILVTKDGFEYLTPFTKDHNELIVGK